MTQHNVLNSSWHSEIKKLSISEKILIVENIRDSISLSNDQPSVTSEQKKELDKRFIDYNKNPQIDTSWGEVKKRIESNL